MKLINGKLWIDLEKYLDMNSFNAIENQITYNIAKNAKYIEPSYTPQLSLFNKELPGYLEERSKYKLEYPELGPSEINWYTKLNGTAILGSQLVLRSTKGYPKTYPHKHLNEHSVNLPPCEDFQFLFDWIEKQNCFDEYGRILFWINEPNQLTAIHTDYSNIELDKRDMFIWLTGRYSKSILLKDNETGETQETNSRAMVFNTVNWHATKGHTNYVSWSLRIDGSFNAEWAKKVGIKEYYNYEV
jgi:hypothetical protein